MPLPTPNKGETEKKFISRCMANPTMVGEYPQNEQRAAICYGQWRNKKDSMSELKIEKDILNKPIDKKNMNTDIQRFDLIEIPIMSEPIFDDLELMETSFKETQEGYLTGRAIVTNIGVFPYLQEDGSVRWELRPPTEVLKEDSLRTLRNQVLVNDHPGGAGKVDIDNAKNLQVGHLGDSVRNNAYHVSTPITVIDKDAVEDVKNGKRALSCGYYMDYDPTPGNWLGVPYDGVQRNIRYNHVAIVDRGRAGDAARMRFDSGDAAVGVSTEIQKIKSDREDIMKTVKIDGVDYQADAEVIREMNRHKKDAEQLKADNEKSKEETDKLKDDYAKLEAERDTLKDKAEKLEKEAAEKMDETKIQAAVKERMRILDAAKKAEVEYKEDESNLDIQKKVILKVSPNANLDGKQQIYIAARFDGAVELLAERAEDEADSSIRIVGASNTGGTITDDSYDSEIHYKNMVADMEKRSREPIIN